MSIQAVAWAIDQKTGSAAGKVVLICLANYADEDGKCWPSQETIAAETELSERSVREWLQKLEDAGLLSRERRKRQDGYRASDLIVLGIKNIPAKSAAKAKSYRQMAPTLPEPVAAPTSFEPSKEPSAAARDDIQVVSDKLFEAVGDKMHPHGGIVIGPILELIAQGVDLETDILPIIKARAARMTRPARSWSYFVEAIRDAHNQRVEAGKGLAQPKVAAVKRDDDMTADELCSTWEKRLNFARPRQEWISWLWGPMPGQPGCRVPSDLLQPRDGKHFDGTPWSDKKQEAA